MGLGNWNGSAEQIASLEPENAVKRDTVTVFPDAEKPFGGQKEQGRKIGFKVRDYTGRISGFMQNILKWLNTGLAVSGCMSFAKSWQEKGCRSQAETWQVKIILMKDFD